VAVAGIDALETPAHLVPTYIPMRAESLAANGRHLLSNLSQRVAREPSDAIIIVNAQTSENGYKRCLCKGVRLAAKLSTETYSHRSRVVPYQRDAN